MITALTFAVLSACSAPYGCNSPRVLVGDIDVQWRADVAGTMSRIAYHDVILCNDSTGDYYGTTLNITGLGFVGSGHSVGGNAEVVASQQLYVDGTAIAEPCQTRYTAATSAVWSKTSSIMGAAVVTTTTITSDHIHELVEITPTTDLVLDMAYNAMHPWSTSGTEWLAVDLLGVESQGVFDDDGSHDVNASGQWLAVWFQALGYGIVTRVLETPATWTHFLWDVNARYRKYYLVSFEPGTMPAGVTQTYSVITCPFAAVDPTWEATARTAAAACVL